MKCEMNIGECQKVYDKYELNIHNHVKETTLLCQVIKNLEEKIDAQSCSIHPVIESRQQAFENFAREYLKKHRTRFINDIDISRSDKAAILHHFGYSAENVPR